MAYHKYKKPHSVYRESDSDGESVAYGEASPPIIEYREERFNYSRIYEYSRLLPFQPLTHYGKKVKKLGEGTYGAVVQYEGPAEADEFFGGGPVAIKIYKSRSQESLSVDFLIEMAVLQRLNHINITEILDYTYVPGSQGGRPGIVLPLATSDLHKYRQNNNTNLDLFAYQMLCSVAYLHSRHIIHRDIKPINFLYYEPDLVTMSDLGAAKPFACQPNNLWTNEVYTLWYRPPEVLLNSIADYSMPADIWALGTSIWELYTGKVLFQGTNPYDQLIKIFAALGTPDNQRWPEALTMLLFPKLVPFSNGDPRIINDPLPNNDVRRILSSMIVLDPKQRATAYDLLRDPYFDTVRNPDAEYKLNGCFVSHETRDRYAKPYTLEETGQNARTVIISQLTVSTNLFKYHMSVLLYTSSLLDQVLPVFDPTGAELPFLALACFSLAADLKVIYQADIEDYLASLGLDSDQNNIDKVNEWRRQVITVIQGDLLFTTPYDYYVEAETLGIQPKIWALAKAIMVLTTISDIRFKLLPHDIFRFSINTSLEYHKEETIFEMSANIMYKKLVANAIKNRAIASMEAMFDRLTRGHGVTFRIFKNWITTNKK